MGKQFDPYVKWLGIREKDQPPTHYRLLGIDRFEDDPDVIEAAADRQMLLLRTKQTSQHRDLSQRLLNEVAAARTCLLNPQQKAAYDQQLRAASQPVIQTADPVHSRLQGRPAWQLPAVLGGVVVLLLLIGAGAFFVFRPGEQAEPIAQGAPADSATGEDGSAETPPVAKEDGVDAEGNEDASSPASDTSPAADPGFRISESNTPYVSPTTPKPDPSAPAASEGPQPAAESKTPLTAGPAERVENGSSDPADGAGKAQAGDQEQAKRRPVPETSAVEKATTLIHEIYTGEFEAVGTDDDAAAALIKKLREQAGETTEDETARYALLSVARRLAIDAQAQEAAIALTRQIAEEYEVDRWESIVKTLQQLYAAARTTDERKEFVALAARTIDEAMQAEELEAAARIVEEGKTAALRARDVELRKQMADLADHVEQQLAIRKAVAAAKAALPKNADDPAANETLGRYLCLERGEWKEGLAHLAKAGEPTLRQLAETDLAEPEDAAKQADLGERWFTWATADKSDREGFLAAAHFWYQRALPELTGLDKVRVERRLELIGKVPRPRTADGEVQIASTSPSATPSPSPRTTPTQPTPIPTDLKGGTAPPPPKSNSPADQLAFNRAMAEWIVREKHGSVGLRFPDGSLRNNFAKVEKLPNGPFMISSTLLTGKKVEDGDLPSLAALTKLEVAALGGNSLSNRALALLGDCKSIRQLRIGGTPLDDETLARLCRALPQLVALQISSTAVTDEGLQAVGQLTKLTHFHAADNDIGDNGLAHLRGMKSLQVLTLFETNVGDAGLAHIATIPSLEWLAISITKVTGAGLSHLDGMPNLQTLYLRNLDIKDDDLAQLVGLPRLQEVYLGNVNITDAGLEHLARIPTLTRLGLEHTRVTNAGVQRLQAALPRAKITH